MLINPTLKTLEHCLFWITRNSPNNLQRAFLKSILLALDKLRGPIDCSMHLATLPLISRQNFSLIVYNKLIRMLNNSITALFRIMVDCLWSGFFFSGKKRVGGGECNNRFISNCNSFPRWDILNFLHHSFFFWFKLLRIYSISTYKKCQDERTFKVRLKKHIKYN